MGDHGFLDVKECAAELARLAPAGWTWKTRNATPWPEAPHAVAIAIGRPIGAPSDVKVHLRQELCGAVVAWTVRAIGYEGLGWQSNEKAYPDLKSALEAAGPALRQCARIAWARRYDARERRSLIANAVERGSAPNRVLVWLRSLLDLPSMPDLWVYVAGGLAHIERARAVRALLDEAGFRLLYDWTAHGSVAGSLPEHVRGVAHNELRSAVCADLVLALPGGTGTAIEIGAAIAAGVPVLWLRPESERLCSFEHLKGVEVVRLHPDHITPERATWEVMRHFFGALAGPCPSPVTP